MKKRPTRNRSYFIETLATLLALAGFIGFTALASLNAHADLPRNERGTDNGVGGAGFKRKLTAFFLSDDRNEPVSACFEVAKNFGISPESIRPMIESGFRKWSDYLVEKNLYSTITKPIFIQTNLQLRSQCQGDENLTFYFGVRNPIIEASLEKGILDSPFGFAQVFQNKKTEPVNGSYRVTQPSRGLVWIAGPGEVDEKERIPSWSSFNEPALEGLLLHEIGHVFGNDEIRDTVMTPDLADFLSEDTKPGSTLEKLRYYAKIDSQIELILCLRCRAHYQADVSRSLVTPPGQEYDSDPENTFFLLTGERPQGKVTMYFDRKVGMAPGSGLLTVLDERTQLTPYFVEVLEENIEVPDNVPQFSGFGGRNHYSSTTSLAALLHISHDRGIEVTINYNSDSRKLIIKQKDDLHSPNRDFFGRVLFRSED